MVSESVHFYVAALAFPRSIKASCVRHICLSLHPVVGSHRDTTPTSHPLHRTTLTKCHLIFATCSEVRTRTRTRTSHPSLVENPPPALDQHPLSPTTSLSSLGLRSLLPLGPDVSRGATPQLDHTYPPHSEIQPTMDRSARPYSEAVLPGPVPRAEAHLQAPNNPRLLNIVDPVLVSFIYLLSPDLALRLFLGPHYQIRSPDAPYMYTPTSSRTGSSASLHPGTPSVAFLQPLSRSTSHTQTSKKMPSRPALKSANTWTGTGTASSAGSTCIPYLHQLS